MTFQRHIVRRQVIELEIPARLDRVDIQNRVARLFHDRLVPMIDRHLSLKSPPGQIDQIEKLEINLGKLHISRLEKGLLDRIEEELQIQLNPIVMKSAATEVEDQKPPKGSDIELITYFLQTGAFPWWAINSNASELEQAFENAARSEPPRLRNLLSHLLRDDRILQRCVYACNEKILERIMEVCFSSGELVKLHKAKQNISGSLGIRWAEPGLRQIWWYCVIRAVVVPPSQTPADITSGIVQLFMQLADLPGHVAQSLEDSGILLQGKSSQPQIGIDSQLDADVIKEMIAQLGILSESLPTIGFLLSNDGMQQIIEHLKSIEEAIDKDGAREASMIRTDRWKRTQQQVKSIQKIIGSQTDRPYVSSDHSQAINLSDAKKRQLAEVASGFEKIKDALTSLLSRYNGPGPQVRLKKLLQRPAKKAILSRKLYDAFSDSDKIYVQNAGLVLLWPFLNRFFMNLELSDEKAFVDADAAERACLVLQYLADGDAENIFEAQLPLNKIICGLDLYQPVNTQWQLDADEQEVADGLLDAVIQNSPLWKNLSADGFRQAYLQREGILGTRDGHWLLQVKRETHDIIVDRLPWTIQVVKLPWMERLIFVEWQQS